jgi:integrase
MPRSNLYRRRDGGDARILLGTSNRAEAERRLAELRLNESRWKSDKKAFTLLGAFRRYCEEDLQHLKQSSRLRYIISIEHLERLIGDRPLEEISSSVLKSFETARRSEGRTASTIRRDLACLSTVFTSAMTWEWVIHNPVIPYLKGRAKRGLREADPHTRNLSEGEEHLLLRAAPEWRADIWRFLIDTGLRREEALGLTWDHVNLTDNEIIVVKERAKSNRQRRVPIVERSRAILQRWRQRGARHVIAREDGQRYTPKSPTLWEALKRDARRAGIPPLTIHDLRRTCGCRLLQLRGFTLPEVRDWLGHSSTLQTETTYAFLAPDALHVAVQRSESTRHTPGTATNVHYLTKAI